MAIDDQLFLHEIIFVTSTSQLLTSIDVKYEEAIYFLTTHRISQSGLALKHSFMRATFVYYLEMPDFPYKGRFFSENLSGQLYIISGVCANFTTVLRKVGQILDETVSSLRSDNNFGFVKRAKTLYIDIHFCKFLLKYFLLKMTFL